MSEFHTTPAPDQSKSSINMNPNTFKQERNKRYTKIFWKLFKYGSLGIFLYFAITWIFLLPSFEELENPSLRVASTIVAADGSSLGKFFEENRTPIKYEELPQNLVNALIATEDERFYNHAGIDAEAMARVVKGALTRNESAGGGSTVTQQFAKMLLGRPETKGWRKIFKYPLLINAKFQEWMTAVKLERSYTKEEIIALYFNQVDFLYGAHGIKSAAETYFSKKPKDLNIQECALFVGMLKNPALFNPRRNMGVAMTRRMVVLDQMRSHGYLHSDTTRARRLYDSLKVLPIDISKFKRLDHNEGLAPHFRENLRQEVKKILKDLKKHNGKPYDLYRDGLKIYTTIDPKMQAHAERAAREHLSEMQKHMFAHWKNMDPWTHPIPSGNETQVPIEARQSSLKKLIWESDRWDVSAVETMPTAAEYELRAVDIDRMITAENAGGKKSEMLKNWLKTKYINNDLYDKYTETMASNDWGKIKREYNAMMEMMKKPVKTRVFAYKGNMPSEKDTVMSPYDSIKYHRMILQTGMVAIEPQTGHVKAWVGGADHHYFKFDHVYNNGKFRRQVGSTIKPLLYGLSFELKGYNPCYLVPDAPICIAPGQGNFRLASNWCPHNAGSRWSGRMVTMKYALQQSLNSVSAFLMKEMNSTKDFRNFLGKVGVDTLNVPPQPSICLGSCDLSVLEMGGAYTIFGNEGEYTSPIYILKIEDKNGSVIYNGIKKTFKQDQALSPSSAYAMTHMLEAVVEKNFGDIKSHVGGKTGTTNDQSDAWFMGVTPSLVVATWTGCDDRFVRFRSLGFGQGAKMARPIFNKFLKYVEADKGINYVDTLSFKKPDPMNIELNCTAYSGPMDALRVFHFNEENPDINGDEGEWGDEIENLILKPKPEPIIENLPDGGGDDDPAPAPTKPKPALAPTTGPKKKPGTNIVGG